MKSLFAISVLVLGLIGNFAPAAVPLVDEFGAPVIRVRQGVSINWSGYAVETNLSSPASNVVTDVRGQWVVPTLSCGSSNTYSSAWVGIDGYSSNTVEQTGTEHDCKSGTASYYAWYELYPKPGWRINKPVSAGDTFAAQVTYASGNKYNLTITNVGKWSYSTTQTNNGQRSSAEWVVEAPWSGGVLPLANFGTISFSGAQATINGHTGTISDSNWQKDPITMVTSDGTVKAQPSGLSPDGTGFSVTWQHS